VKTSSGKWLVRVVLAVMLCSTWAGSAHADPIGPDCVSCQGSIYWLLYTSVNSADPSVEKYNVLLRIDTSGYAGTASAIDTVAVKVASSIIDASLISAPAGNWNLAFATLNANGCGVGGGGWACVQELQNGGYPSAGLGSILEWNFAIATPAGGLFDGTNESSIKARYVNDDGKKVGDLVSENIRAQTHGVPEPVSLEIFGFGLLAAGALVYRRTRRNRHPHVG
jgi:hypothetical protein